MQISIWEVIIIFGAVQGFVFGTIILYKRSRRPYSNLLMAGLFYIFALASFGIFLEQSGLTKTSQFIYQINRYLPFFHVILIGPFIYLFTRLEMDSSYIFSRKEKHHFYLGIWTFVPTAILIVRFLGIEFYWFPKPTLDNIDYFLVFFKRYGEVFLWLVTTSYLVTALGVYHRFKGSPRSTWIRQFLNIFLFFQFGIWLPVLIVNVSPFKMLIPEIGLDYDFIYGPMVIFIYWIGLRWALDAPTLTFKSKTKEELEKTLPRELIRKCIDELKFIMESQKLFLRKDLSIKTVADIIGAKEKTLNYVLNQEMGITFQEFVDSFRINKAAREMLGMDYSKKEVEKIALSSGFTNLPDFQRTFQAFKEMTPREYIRKNKVEAVAEDF